MGMGTAVLLNQVHANARSKSLRFLSAYRYASRPVSTTLVKAVATKKSATATAAASIYPNDILASKGNVHSQLRGRKNRQIWNMSLCLYSSSSSSSFIIQRHLHAHAFMSKLEFFKDDTKHEYAHEYALREFTTKSSSSQIPTPTTIGEEDEEEYTFGTKTVIKSTPHACNPSHPLAPYVHHSIQKPLSSSSQPSSPVKPNKDTNFAITFLGTGAGGRPNAKRAPTSTALTLPHSSNIYLFDAGEGTQRQLSLSQLGIKGITKIFVTHLHADHVVGLLGIVLMKEMLAKDHGGQGKHARGGDDESRRKGGGSARLKLELYGPVGLFNYVAMNLALTCSKIRNIDLIVHELVRDDNRHQTRHDRQDHGRRKSHNHNHNRMTNILHRTYPELIHKNANAHIQHKKIYQNKLDQTWTIQTPRTLQHDSVPTGGKHADQYLSIQAAEVLHQPGIQTFGYVVREPTPTPKIDVQKAKDLGIRPSAKYRSLKNGFKVMNDDGSREVLPEEVLDGESASATKGRTLAILGDAWKVPNPMKRLAFGADVLVHEATLSKTLEHRSRQRGHSTAGMAGRVAKELQCKILVMNHISGRMDGNGSRSGSGSRNGDNSNDNAKANAYADDEGVDTLLEEAVSTNGDVSDILVAHDFMMVQIPKRSSK